MLKKVRSKIENLAVRPGKKKEIPGNNNEKHPNTIPLQAISKT
jgi:hypothetical protein